MWKKICAFFKSFLAFLFGSPKPSIEGKEEPKGLPSPQNEKKEIPSVEVKEEVKKEMTPPSLPTPIPPSVEPPAAPPVVSKPAEETKSAPVVATPPVVSSKKEEVPSSVEKTSQKTSLSIEKAPQASEFAVLSTKESVSGQNKSMSIEKIAPSKDESIILASSNASANNILMKNSEEIKPEILPKDLSKKESMSIEKEKKSSIALEVSSLSLPPEKSEWEIRLEKLASDFPVEIPTNYKETYIHLIEVDPFSVFVFYEISPQNEAFVAQQKGLIYLEICTENGHTFHSKSLSHAIGSQNILLPQDNMRIRGRLVARWENEVELASSSVLQMGKKHVTYPDPASWLTVERESVEAARPLADSKSLSEAGFDPLIVTEEKGISQPVRYQEIPSAPFFPRGIYLFLKV